MRRLVALASATVLFNTIFLAVLEPPLPGLSERSARFGQGASAIGWMDGLAGLVGDALPILLLGGTCAATLRILRRGRGDRRPAHLAYESSRA